MDETNKDAQTADETTENSEAKPAGQPPTLEDRIVEALKKIYDADRIVRELTSSSE